MPARRSAKSPGIIDAAVGRNVRFWRLAKRMSQARLANRIGVSFQQVQKYELGSNRIGSGRLARIAKVLGVPVRTLFDGVESAVQAQTTSMLHLLADARAFRLARAFAVISDATIRVAIVTLVELAAAAIAPRRKGKQPKAP
jgi:transcriptional regulator with XRE-family HTH domain